MKKHYLLYTLLFVAFACSSPKVEDTRDSKFVGTYISLKDGVVLESSGVFTETYNGITVTPYPYYAWVNRGNDIYITPWEYQNETSFDPYKYKGTMSSDGLSFSMDGKTYTKK